MNLQHYFTRENVLLLPVLLLILSVLIGAHEYGHYLFARLFGMGVEEFAIGFGPRPIWIYARKKYRVALGDRGVEVLPGPQNTSKLMAAQAMLEGAEIARRLEGEEPSNADAHVIDTPSGQVLEETTKFTVRAIPLGGFVRIKGMIPQDDGGETRIPGGFYSKEPWKRLIVLLAGPVFSVLAGIILLFIVFATVGALDTDKKPVVGDVGLQSPALAAGLKKGDLITSIDGVPTKTTYDLLSHIRFGGEKAHPMTYVRGGKSYSTSITPVTLSEPTPVANEKLEPSGKMAKQAMIGITWNLVYVRMSVPEAAVAAVTAPARAVILMAGMFRSPEKLKDSVGGPLAIVQATRSAIHEGLPDVLGTAAMLSISLGIFNLLPIVPLDGGQIAIAIAEMFRRRRLSMRSQNLAAAAGMLVVLLIFITVMTVDVQKVGKPSVPKFSDMVKQQEENSSKH